MNKSAARVRFLLPLLSCLFFGISICLSKVGTSHAQDSEPSPLEISPETGDSTLATTAYTNRTEKPGAFLSWPLPSTIGANEITRILDTPWTHWFLGITDCPPYPALIDDGYWESTWFQGYFDTNALPGTTKERVRWRNSDDGIASQMYNAFACYGAGLSNPDHAGTDIRASNGTRVNVAASGVVQEITKHASSCGSNSDVSQYKVVVRHDNVNGSGQTWFTIYRHTINPVNSLLNQTVTVGTKIAEVGCDHLHFETTYGGIYDSHVRNHWGIDSAPWDGCLWLDSTICPVAPPQTCCGCTAITAASDTPPLGGELVGPPHLEDEPRVAFDLTTLGAQSVAPQTREDITTLDALPSLPPTSHDESAPIGAVQVNGGEETSPTLPVTLNLTAVDEHSGVSQMRFSADGFNWSEWEPYVTTRPWQLAGVGEPQTIYAQFRDRAGNDSAVVSVTITANLTTALPSSANYWITRSVMGMGGGASSSINYRLVGTSGQPYQTGLLSSSSYRLSSGYWGGTDAETFNTSPTAPTNPSPATNAINISITAALSWSAIDPENDPLTYEVRFGTSNPPPQVVASQSATTYDPPGDLASNTPYYWQIIADDGRGGETPGPVWSFTTAVAPTLFPNVFYVSSSGKATIGGIAVTGADILRYTKSTNVWTLIYDGSARGTSKNLGSFALLDDGSLLLVFSANQPIAGLGTATPYDVVKFTPDNPSVLPLGGGAFSWFFQAKPNGLTTSGEKIDAIDLVGDRLLLSTTGGAKLPLSTGTTLTAADEDVFAYNLTTGQWESTLVIDGSLISGMGSEDISSVWDDPQSSDYYITIIGSFKLGGVRGNGKSVVKLSPNGGSSVYTPSLVQWLASGAPMPANLDALEIAQ